MPFRIHLFQSPEQEAAQPSGFHRGFDRLLSSSFRFRSCSLSSLIQLRLLNPWCVGFVGGVNLSWTGFSGQAPSLTSEAGYRP